METVDYGFEEEIENKELALEIHKALHTLEMPYKEVFWLRSFADLSFSQIGALFEKTAAYGHFGRMLFPWEQLDNDLLHQLKSMV